MLKAKDNIIVQVGRVWNAEQVLFVRKNLVFTPLSLFSLFFVVLYGPVQTCQRNLPARHEGLVNLLSIKVDFKV